MARISKGSAACMLIPLGLCGQLLSSQALPCAAEGASRIEITVRVYNYSWATLRDIEETEAVATRILDRSGISAHWVQCSPVWDEAVSSQCGSPLSRTILQLLITNKPQGFRSDALGFTIGRLPVFTVSYNKSRDLAALHALPVGLVLGHIAVHEIGHILLDSNQHALSGVMKARFGPEDLDDMDRAWLRFTPEQSRLLRTRFGCLSK